MKIRILFLLSVLLGMAACRGQSPGQIVITNGTIVDGRGSEPIHDGIVVIDGDRIAFVGSAADYALPFGAQIVDAHGGTILPGFIDAHVHSASSLSIRRQFLEDGVTAVCDLGSPLADMARFATEYSAEEAIARGFRAGPILTAPGGLPDAVLEGNLNYEVGTPEEARAAVADLDGRDADVVKVYLQEESVGVAYPMLGEDELAAIVEAAHERGLLVRAHVTYVFLLDDAIGAGVDVVEHVPIYMTASESEIPESELEAYYESSLAEMAEAGIVMIPTLDRPFGDFFRASDLTPEQATGLRAILAVVGGFHEMGGDVGLGTDWNVGIGVPAGMPMGEMEMLLAAGLSPMDVIEAGTRVSAYACGHGSELGTLEPGKLADIIVVDGDPLQDLQVMSEVTVVIKNGEIAVASEGMLSR